jgi:predicted ribosomally synthesized peptide with SipW-like signal peptide
MSRILISLGIIGIAAAVAVGATTAFFSDTETSSGNTFTAGAIDLTIDNVSYLNGESSTATSWGFKDLEKGDLFFDFADLKPGDEGEDTISLHVTSNKAWACFDITITGTPENSCVDPEVEDGDTTCACRVI